jgi:recombination protein RecA
MIARSPYQAPATSHVDLQLLAESVNSRLHARAVQVGPGAVPRRGVVSSGFPALDATTGIGGFPRGRITELIGLATSGCETVAAHTVAAADGYSAWVDVPGLADVYHLARCGVELERLFILRPRKQDDALAVTAQLLASGQFSVVVLDGLDDLPRGGETAKAVARFVRVVAPSLGRSTTAGLVLSAPDREYRPLAHAAGLRISLAQAGLIRRGGVFRGWRTRARVLKSPGAIGSEVGLEIWL